MKNKFCENLVTPFEKDTSCTWQEYPRPQMKRDSYISLSGDWELYLIKDNTREKLGNIQAPFPPESRLSNISRTLKKGEKYLYCKTIRIPSEFIKSRVILNFGAVDQIAEVTLNGKVYPKHEGGYLPFSLDITNSVRVGENILEVEVEDDFDTDFAYGKQSRKRGGMWYTAVSGIWQSVFIESVPENYIEKIKITTTLNEVQIETVGGNSEKRITISDTGEEFSYTGDSITLQMKDAKLWTPDTPYLYYFKLSDGEDEIESYFALRTVSVEKRGDTPYICLNSKPYFFNALLDRGYFSDGIYTPATPQGYVFDILEMKKMGFNTLRKHAKIEPDLFYYYCDKYGMAVFQDIVNSGKYSFLRDTALPTLGIKKGINKKVSRRRRDIFISEAKGTLETLYNHPSVVYYTIFNEGWGQFDADGMYSLLKNYDTTRIYDSTSGWFFETMSDVDSHHVYFKPIRLKSDKKRPLVLSEFGGYSCKIKDHSYNLLKTYGYKFFKNEAEFSASLEKLYLEEVIPAVKQGLCAAVLTQVSDIEDETNGLVTYDRQYVKIPYEKMSGVSRKIFTEFEKNLNKKSK